MEKQQKDCVFVISSSSKVISGFIKYIFSNRAPTWALLLAQSIRSVGHDVSIIDANAENLSNESILKELRKENPRPCLFCRAWTKCECRNCKYEWSS